MIKRSFIKLFLSVNIGLTFVQIDALINNCTVQMWINLLRLYQKNKLKALINYKAQKILSAQ